MIYAIGLDTDPTFVHFLRQMRAFDRRVEVINLRAIIAEGSWQLGANSHENFVLWRKQRVELSPNGGYYCRMIDLSSISNSAQNRATWRNLLTGLNAFLELHAKCVINKPSGELHNCAKPLHEAVLMREGFFVPESLTTSDSKELIHFCSVGPAIAKTLSGVRANCRKVNASDFQRYRPQQGPVHLQRQVAGHDVRVHCVGEETFSARVESGRVDYRTDRNASVFLDHVLPSKLESRIIEATQKFGLVMAGWDFKVDASGRYWCLEANSMPGYDNHDRQLKGKITKALTAFLCAKKTAGESQ